MFSAAFIGVVLPALLVGQTQVQFGAYYSCPGGTRFKVFSCAGNDPNSPCDVQTFRGMQSLSRGPAPRAQVLGFVKACHLQSAAEEKALSAHPERAPRNEVSSNGIKVGDSVEVLTGFGWSPAKVIAIQGDDYKVNTNGVQVVKTYPAEVRRIGVAKVQDHAAAPASAAVARTTGPPHPGMTSCAGKIEGRYVTTGAGSATIIFRSGKATMGNGFGGEDTLECWMSGDKLILREPGHPESEMPIDMNNDGTLQVPIYGEFKKKGN
jgi:hypothetical protein